MKLQENIVITKQSLIGIGQNFATPNTEIPTMARDL